MKKKDFLWSLLAMLMVATLSVGLSSCSKDDPDPVLKVSTNKVEFDAKGEGDGDVQITVEHTGWTASIPEGSSWIELSEKKGDASYTLTISVKSENTSTKENKGKVRINSTSGSITEEITVVQTGVDGTLTVSDGSVEFDPEGGSQTIQVTSNSGWNVSGSQSWLTVSPSSGNAPTSGSEAKTVTLSVGENTTKDARSCTLTFTTSDNKSSASVTVTQKKPNPFILVNGLESTSLSFSSSSGVNYKQTVKVTSNVSWTMNGIPEWLSVSPTNGSGEISIDIYPKTDNNADDKERTAQLVLISGDTRATIKVSQETDLDSDAYVNPTNIVTLYNGIAFDYDFGKTVSYYYRGYMEKSAVASMTDAEIITVLEENFRRYTQSDNEVAVFSGLDEGVSYMVYTVGYNKNGKRGKLTKNEITTKTLQSNEPMAWIYDPTYDSSYWYWTVEKSATCYSYYMISTEDLDFAIAEDVYQAWMIDYYIRKGWTSEYVNGGDWYSQRTGSIIAIMTWGLDKKENFANKIYWNAGMISDSAPKKMQRKTMNVKTDKNYPILGKGKLAVHKKK